MVELGFELVFLVAVPLAPWKPVSDLEAGLLSHMTRCLRVKPRAWHREWAHSMFVDWTAQLGGVLLPLDWPAPHCLRSFILLPSVSSSVRPCPSPGNTAVEEPVSASVEAGGVRAGQQILKGCGTCKEGSTLGAATGPSDLA